MNARKISLRVLVAIGGFTLVAFWLVSQLGFDYDFEKFFPKGDPESDFYFDFREHFGTDNDFMLIALENDAGIFEQDFLTRADALVDSLDQIEHIETVLSPTRFPDHRMVFGSLVKKDLIRINEPQNYAIDSARVYSLPGISGSFVSPDAKAICIQIQHQQFLDKAGCDSLAQSVTRVLDQFEFDGEHAMGRAIGQGVYVEMMKWEMVLFISLSMALIVTFLIVAFRSAWGVWVPLTVVMLSITWTMAITKLLGQEIDLMMAILPTILFVVGMSDVVHILNRYFEELRGGQEKLPALKVAFKEVGIATFLTSLTTAIGFLTLLTSTIEPIRNFGVYTAIGVFVAYLLAYSLLPAVLVLSKTPPLLSDRPQNDFWTRRMHAWCRWTLRNRKGVLIGSVVVLALGAWGTSRVYVDNYMLEDLREDHFLKQEFKYMSDKFAGVRPFELALTYDTATVDPLGVSFLTSMEKLDSYLQAEYGVGNLMSPARLVQFANQARNGGNLAYLKVPTDPRDLRRLTKLMERSGEGSVTPLGYFIDRDKGYVRIRGQVADTGRKHYDRKNEELTAWLDSELADAPFGAKVTGTAHLIDVNNDMLSINMIKGLGIAFIIIALIVGIMYRSVTMVLISLVPNMLPLILISAIMGFCGIYLKVSTSIIFTIAFGIAVDDTIHFLSKFRIQLAKGRTWQYALKRTYLSTGKAIVVTTLILCAGFITLVFSDFLGTFYIGLLISLTLAFAVLSDLFLLPVLIILTSKFDLAKRASKKAPTPPLKAQVAEAQG